MHLLLDRLDGARLLMQYVRPHHQLLRDSRYVDRVVDENVAVDVCERPS